MFRHQLRHILSFMFLCNLSGYGQSDFLKLFKQLNQLNQPTQVQFIHTGVTLEPQSTELNKLNSSNNVFLRGRNSGLGSMVLVSCIR